MSTVSVDSPVTPRTPASDGSLSMGELDIDALLAPHDKGAPSDGPPPRNSWDSSSSLELSDDSSQSSPAIKQQIGRSPFPLPSPQISDTPEIKVKGVGPPLLVLPETQQATDGNSNLDRLRDASGGGSRRELFAGGRAGGSNNALLARLARTGSSLMSPPRASLDLGTDSESEAIAKQRFFERVEKHWHASHEAEDQPDYAALNKVDLASSTASVDKVLGRVGDPEEQDDPPRRPSLLGQADASPSPSHATPSQSSYADSYASYRSNDDSAGQPEQVLSKKVTPPASESSEHPSRAPSVTIPSPAGEAPRSREPRASPSQVTERRGSLIISPSEPLATSAGRSGLKQGDNEMPSNSGSSKLPALITARPMIAEPPALLTEEPRPITAPTARPIIAPTSESPALSTGEQAGITAIPVTAPPAKQVTANPPEARALSADQPAPRPTIAPPRPTIAPPSEAPALSAEPSPSVEMRSNTGSSKQPALSPQPGLLQLAEMVRGGKFPERASDQESTAGGRHSEPQTTQRKGGVSTSQAEGQTPVSVAGQVRRAAALQAASAAAARLEDLRRQLAEEREARQVAAKRLGEQRKETEKNERRIKEAWEAKLREVQKEKYSLSIRLQELEGENPKQRLLRGGPEVHLTEQELKALRQDIKEQETLIKGYQAENERLMEASKEAALEGKERARLMMEENARLATALAQAQQDHSLKTADAASHLHRILHLEGEVEAVKSEAAARELDLKFELDKARQARKELEAKYAGLDPAKMAEEDRALAAAKQELAQQRETHAKEVAELEKKVRWYVENQEILDRSQETIQEQAKTISELQARLATYEGAAAREALEQPEELKPKGKQPKTVGAATANARAGARIRHLEKQVKTLEAELAAVRTAPNSLAALVAATKPTAEESTLVGALRGQLVTLRAELDQKDNQAALALRSLRQEHERVKVSYEARLAALKQQQGGGQKKSEGERVAAGRAKELERQVEELRDFYNKKVKDLTKKLEDATKAGAKEKGLGDPPQGVPKKAGVAAQRGRQLAQANERIAELERLLAEKTSEVQALQQTPRPAEDLQSQVTVLEHKCLELQGLLQTQGEAADRFRQAAFGEGKENLLPREAARWQAKESSVEDIVTLRRALEMAEMARDMAQKQATDAIERAAVLRLQHHQTVARLQEAHAQKLAAVRCGSDQGQLESHLAAAEARCKGLEVELEKLRKELQRLRNAPHSEQYLEMEARIATMEEKQRDREAQWQALLERTQATLDIELDAERAKWQQALEAKNAEIEEFRIELEAIIRAATSLQQADVG